MHNDKVPSLLSSLQPVLERENAFSEPEGS